MRSSERNSRHERRMITRQCATVKRSFSNLKLQRRSAKARDLQTSLASNRGLPGCPHNPTVSPDAKAPDRARIRILSVDNHPLFREGIAAILKKQPDMALVSQASTGQEAIQLHRNLQPDITLMEIWLPDLGGIDALIAIRAEFPAARVIMLTTRDGDFEVHRALAAGAAGYLLKETSATELLRGIRKVHSGRKAIQSQLAAKLAECMGEDTLTPREIEVLMRAAEGSRNREIGQYLCIAEETVKAHLKRLREKLKARDRAEAVVIAVRRGIIRL